MSTRALSKQDEEELAEFDHLPDEFRLDPYSPLNDPYFRHTKGIRQALIAHKAKMRPKHVSVAHLYRNGHPHKHIAATVKYSVGTIAQILARADVKKYISLLNYLSSYTNGPTEDMRKHMLWRISVDNEQEQPKTAISAVDLLNKMDGTYKDDDDKGRIQITFNGNVFMKGALDQPANTFESRKQDIEDV